MIITNMTKQSFRLATGHEIKPGKNQLPKTVLMHPDNGNYIAGLEASGRIRTGLTTATKQRRETDQEIAKSTKPFTRGWVAHVGRGVLADLAEAHGFEPELYRKVTDDELRSHVARAMFVDL